MGSYKVSVIVPIYNVAPYLGRCLYSLFEQTLDNIEYIFINDCSSDNSIDILHYITNLYPNRRPHVRIFTHHENRGVGSTRATGMRMASGEYIIHCDPDDYVDTNLYEDMYNAARENKLDIVICDYIRHEIDGHTKKIHYSIERTPQEILIKYYKKNHWMAPLWDKMVKREIIFLNMIFPPEGSTIEEDLWCSIRILHFGSSIGHIRSSLYHYVIRENSIIYTTRTKLKWDNQKKIRTSICKFLEVNPHYSLTSHFLKFALKMDYYICDDIMAWEWFNTYKESHSINILRYNGYSMKFRVFFAIVLKNFTLYKLLLKFQRRRLV